MKKIFEEVYYTYSAYLYRIGINILQDQELASDALQQCFMKIFENIHKVDQVSSKQTKSFVSVIMQNEALSIYNKRKCMADVTELKEEGSDIIDEDADIDKILARAELKEEVQYYLNVLSEQDCQIINLKYMKEFSYKEIAGLYNVSQDVVRKRLSRAKKRLADLIIDDRR
ncbi:MAG: RNA polymerase sigma factor [Anaerovoracaceae bacterium]|jgi:RNA polymerase sigma-70 factor (ECF subfamily)